MDVLGTCGVLGLWLGAVGVCVRGQVPLCACALYVSVSTI